jgi:hypothetical protein
MSDFDASWIDMSRLHPSFPLSRPVAGEITECPCCGRKRLHNATVEQGESDEGLPTVDEMVGILNREDQGDVAT